MSKLKVSFRRLRTKFIKRDGPTVLEQFGRDAVENMRWKEAKEREWQTLSNETEAYRKGYEDRMNHESWNSGWNDAGAAIATGGARYE